jgi:hypothetical protein
LARRRGNVERDEPLPSGLQPVTNLKRRRDGTSDGAQLVGNYNNPILKPAAGPVVKQKGELSIAGKGFPNLSDQCRLYAPPFTFAMQLNFQMLQYHDESKVLHVIGGSLGAGRPLKTVVQVFLARQK